MFFSEIRQLFKALETQENIKVKTVLIDGELYSYDNNSLHKEIKTDKYNTYFKTNISKDISINDVFEFASNSRHEYMHTSFFKGFMCALVELNVITEREYHRIMYDYNINTLEKKKHQEFITRKEKIKNEKNIFSKLKSYFATR